MALNGLRRELPTASSGYVESFQRPLDPSANILGKPSAQCRPPPKNYMFVFRNAATQHVSQGVWTVLWAQVCLKIKHVLKNKFEKYLVGNMKVGEQIRKKELVAPPCHRINRFSDFVQIKSNKTQNKLVSNDF